MLRAVYKSTMIKRRQFLKQVAKAGILAGAGGPLGGCTHGRLGGRRTERPNIIFILADDLGYGDLGCYGQKTIKTPNLDKMAAGGMRFTQHYAGSTVCAPSRCSLLTGLHTGHCTIRDNDRVLLRDQDVTVAEFLRGAGYATGAIGKWGLGHPPPPGDPRRHGFDYFFGYLSMVHAHNYYPEFLWKNEKKFPLRNTVEYVRPDRPDHLGGFSTDKVDYSHDIFTNRALEFLDDNRSGPFFLYLAYTIPHANNEGGRATGNGMEVPDYGIYADKDWPEPQKGHAAMITRMDRDIGRLFDRLKALGIDENTIVFFSSDNGPHKEGGAAPAFFESSGPLRGFKRDLYEGGIRVPFMARWPGRIAAGSVSNHISAFWDFLPTACGLAGVAAPRNTDGISIVPELVGGGRHQAEHQYLYWEFKSTRAVRAGRWKAVLPDIKKDPAAALELYDLSGDIAERRNVAASHPDAAARLAGYIEAAHVKAAGDVRP